jgi:hypothetical protein
MRATVEYRKADVTRIFKQATEALLGSRYGDWAMGLTDGFRFPIVARDFSILSSVYLLWDPSSLLRNGYWRLFTLGIKRPGRETDNAPSL